MWLAVSKTYKEVDHSLSLPWSAGLGTTALKALSFDTQPEYVVKPLKEFNTDHYTDMHDSYRFHKNGQNRPMTQ